MKKNNKGVFGLFEQYLFVLMFIAGAVIVQSAAAWFSKNPFTLVNFAWLLPLLVLSQYFIMAGYHDGTATKGFIETNIFWIAILVFVTLAVNFVAFGNVPGPLTLFALALAAIASAMAAMGK